MPDDRPAVSASGGGSSAPSEADDSLEEIHAELAEHLSSWTLKLGPVYVTRSFGSQRITGIYVTLHVALLLGGAALIVWSRGPLQDLGTALVVGSLFAFGAFVAQVWALQVERERWVYEGATRERIDDLLERATRLQEMPPDGDNSKSVEEGPESNADLRS